jgi:hypothetical protein
MKNKMIVGFLCAAFLFGCEEPKSNSNSIVYVYEVKLISSGVIMKTMYFDTPRRTETDGTFMWWDESNRLQTWNGQTIITRVIKENVQIEK